MANIWQADHTPREYVLCSAILNPVLKLVQTQLQIGVILLPEVLPQLVHAEFPPNLFDVHGLVVEGNPEEARRHRWQLARVSNGDDSPPAKR